MQRYPNDMMENVLNLFNAFDQHLITQNELKNAVRTQFVMHGFTLAEADEYNFQAFENDHEWDGFNSDAEADADVLRSAGWGTDEDYGYYGDSDADY